MATLWKDTVAFAGGGAHRGAGAHRVCVVHMHVKDIVAFAGRGGTQRGHGHTEGVWVHMHVKDAVAFAGGGAHWGTWRLRVLVLLSGIWVRIWVVGGTLCGSGFG